MGQNWVMLSITAAVDSQGWRNATGVDTKILPNDTPLVSLETWIVFLLSVGLTGGRP